MTDVVVSPRRPGVAQRREEEGRNRGSTTKGNSHDLLYIQSRSGLIDHSRSNHTNGDSGRVLIAYSRSCAHCDHSGIRAAGEGGSSAKLRTSHMAGASLGYGVT